MCSPNLRVVTGIKVSVEKRSVSFSLSKKAGFSAPKPLEETHGETQRNATDGTGLTCHFIGKILWNPRNFQDSLQEPVAFMHAWALFLPPAGLSSNYILCADLACSHSCVPVHLTYSKCFYCFPLFSMRVLFLPKHAHFPH